ncbi:MAG: sporulation protein [Flaviaesturariibacter sp.]|nr:sporulation protein [Flaviaesturariibacter sp.]
MLRKIAVSLAALLVVSCSDQPASPADKPAAPDTTTLADTQRAQPPAPAASKPASNQGFRNVTIQKQTDSTFQVTGEARVFEAAFSWVVEDGHRELSAGHETANGGAPAWGPFRFAITVRKDRANSTLHLLLFENSARDGSRRNTLAIPLP